MRAPAGLHRPRLGSAAWHPWWGEAWLQARHGRTQALAGAIALAACGAVVVAMRVVDDPALIRHAGTWLQAGASHAGLLALIAGIAAWRSTRRTAQARVDTLLQGWWRAAPVRHVAVDVVVAAHALAVAAVVIAVLVLAAGGLAWLAHARMPWPALAMPVAAVATGAAVAGAHVAWRQRHPAVVPRTGVRAPLWAPPVPVSRTAPHLFDWQRREGIVRWRSGGSSWVVGAFVALTPGATHPLQFGGVLLMAGVTAWLATVLQASGDVSGRARIVLRATPMSRLGRWRASLGYPAFALGCAGTALLLGTLMAGPALLGLCAAIVVLLASTSIWRLWRTRHVA